VKVLLNDGKPAYKSVLDNGRSINGAIPMLNLAWENNHKALVTITDTAQFIADGEPTDADWQALPPASGRKKVVFVDAALLSLVEDEVLRKKTGGLDALLSVVKVGGSNFQSLQGSRARSLISLGVKERPCSLMGGCSPTPPAGGAASTSAVVNGVVNSVVRLPGLSSILGAPPAARQPRVVEVGFSDRPVSELLQEQ
jgi:hypothetical protein